MKQPSEGQKLLLSTLLAVAACNNKSPSDIDREWVDENQLRVNLGLMMTRIHALAVLDKADTCRDDGALTAPGMFAVECFEGRNGTNVCDVTDDNEQRIAYSVLVREEGDFRRQVDQQVAEIKNPNFTFRLRNNLLNRVCEINGEERPLIKGDPCDSMFRDIKEAQIEIASQFVQKTAALCQAPLQMQGGKILPQ